MQTDQVIFSEERVCTYRHETYCVRDNGAVLRRSVPGGRRRVLDDIWTFGSPSASDGYMGISTHKVHRIVATAFHGDQPSPGHVVDHIDTNRRNNRADNLRWVTRLENILLNPVTAKRVVALYGSIEEFLADPKNPKNGNPNADFEWMRSVSAEEAAYSRKRLYAWATSGRASRGGMVLGDWIFGRGVQPPDKPAPEALVEAKTPGVLQRKWRVPAEFPLCPEVSVERPMEEYFDRLTLGAVAVVSPFGETRVGEVGWSEDRRAILLLGEHGGEAIKPWSVMKVTFEDRHFVHESLGTYFGRDGAEKYFAVGQGKTWNGGDVFDDFA